MKTRILLGFVGVVTALWGAWLVLDVPRPVEVGAWFVAGPIVHDLVLAPVVAVLGWAFRGPAKVGAVISGVLILISVPLVWQESPINPGLHDRDYVGGLAITVGVVWVLVAATAIARKAARARPASGRS